MKPERVNELEKELGIRIPVERRFQYWGDKGKNLEPVYDVAFIFSGDHLYPSDYGFIAPAPSSWTFDVADMWLGQDIMSQLVVKFDGVNGTVTITDPRTHQ